VVSSGEEPFVWFDVHDIDLFESLLENAWRRGFGFADTQRRISWPYYAVVKSLQPVDCEVSPLGRALVTFVSPGKYTVTYFEELARDDDVRSVASLDVLTSFIGDRIEDTQARRESFRGPLMGSGHQNPPGPVQLPATSMSHRRWSNLDFSNANLSGATLSDCSFTYCDLSGAHFDRAHLAQVTFRNSDLSGIDLSSSNISGCSFENTTLSGADLTGSSVGLVNWLGCDLSDVIGLDDIVHGGPSAIGVDTLYESGPGLSRGFLAGSGLPSQFIDYIDSLVTPVAFDLHRSFISYRSTDGAFAERLYADLEARDARVWLDKHELLPGDRLGPSIVTSIRKSDRLLLICSKSSLTTENMAWIDREVDEAFAKEDQIQKLTGERPSVIIPIDIDGYLFSDECDYVRRQQLRDRVACRFKGWEGDDDLYRIQLEQLLKALKTRRAPTIFNLDEPEPRSGS